MTDPARRLRVGFDAGALVFPAGGVRRYVRELFTALPGVAASSAPNVEFVAIGPPAGVVLPPGIDLGSRVPALPSNFARAVLGLPWAMRGAWLDLFHAPAYTAPLVGSAPVVLTIHDVSYARRPEFYAYRSGRARQWFYRRSALAAVRIITDSEFSRREIVAAYGIPESRVAVVPLGAGSLFAPRRDGEATAPLPTGVRTPFLLHVGDLHPRRNVVAAARAVIEELRRRATAGEPPVQLVCAGRDCGSAPGLRDAFEAAGFADALLLTGPISDDQLLALYQRATILVYPSLYEGFGLPVLEAMACGLPVVAVKAGAVPEVLGDAGVLVGEGDDRGMVDAIEALLSQPERRGALRERSLARARTFTWARTAQATLDVYLDCLERLC